jgi:AcrR family transcriptional regulator
VTRAAILDAARSRFAAVGFERATIRSIATAAKVDPALVHHHFGTKQSLFAAAHELPMDPGSLVRAVAAAPFEERGEAMARSYLAIFTAASPAISLIRAAATNEAAARMLREFIEDVFLAHAGDLTPLDRPRMRLALIGSHMLGVAFGRTIVGVSDLRDADHATLVTAVAPTLQRYLSEPRIFDRLVSRPRRGGGSLLRTQGVETGARVVVHSGVDQPRLDLPDQPVLVEGDQDPLAQVVGR